VIWPREALIVTVTSWMKSLPGGAQPAASTWMSDVAGLIRPPWWCAERVIITVDAVKRIEEWLS
jgi:hypothetical protein